MKRVSYRLQQYSYLCAFPTMLIMNTNQSSPSSLHADTTILFNHLISYIIYILYIFTLILPYVFPLFVTVKLCSIFKKIFCRVIFISGWHSGMAR